MGCFVYTVFGSCKDITIGPTALMALMTYQQIAERNTDYAVLLCFLTGIIQFFMAVFHLGMKTKQTQTDYLMLCKRDKERSLN